MVGVIAYAQERDLTGIGRYTQELHAALQKVGLCPAILQAGGTANGSNVSVLPGSRLLPGLLTLGQLEIAWVARRRRLHLIHDPTGTMPFSLTGARRVTTIHDVIPYTCPKSSTCLDWLIYHLWSPIAVRRCDAIITISRQSKRDIARHLRVKSEKITVISIGANRSYRLLEPAEVGPALARYRIESPYILYLGPQVARKNVPRIVEAYARLQDLQCKWPLVIAGSGDWSSSPAWQAVERLALSHRVYFIGYVREADLPALYNGADLFVFPSLYEGFGLPILEAMACGTPVVTSNTTSLPEVAGDAALLVDPTDVDAIADAMRRILEDPVLASDLRARGLERAKQFTWERTARETVKVYEKVLGERLLD